MAEDITFEEHSKLIHTEKFEGLKRADVLEKTRYVVRYCLHGMSLRSNSLREGNARGRDPVLAW